MTEGNQWSVGGSWDSLIDSKVESLNGIAADSLLLPRALQVQALTVNGHFPFLCQLYLVPAIDRRLLPRALGGKRDTQTIG